MDPADRRGPVRRLVSVPDIGAAAVPLARVLRGGLVESVHAGHVVVLAPDGSERFALGDPDATMWARSSLKPLQAVAMLRAGLDVDGAELALVCASHNAEPGHLDVVRAILAGAGLGADDLRNTPDWPLDADAAWQWRADGHGTEPLTQNCSGKHAGMLATCVAAGWPTQDYLDPEHPLQRGDAGRGRRAHRRARRAGDGRRLRRSAVLDDAARARPLVRGPRVR